MNVSKTQKGLSVEYKFFSWCLENGINISQPLSSDSSYDCIIENKEGKLKKIQIKRGYKEERTKSSFCFSVKSTHLTTKGTKIKNYNNLIDGFIAWYEEKPNLFFYVPIEETGTSCFKICITENPLPNQHWYKDYIFDIEKIS